MNSAPAASRQSCSQLARAQNEPIQATAPFATSWILVEQPGPWGPDALTESNLDSGVAAELSRRTGPLNCRVLLIRRRAGRYSGAEVTCYLANAQRAGLWMEQLTLSSPARLLDLPLEDLLTSSTAPGAGPAAQEAFLVCTHGRRDPCCAEYGRALIKELAHGPDVWECSHLGGHRFAANLACFPHGLFYGRVQSSDARPIIERYRAGMLVLDNYRGRSSDDPVVQAADYLVRREQGILGIDALTLNGVAHNGDAAQVEFTDGPNCYRVQLALTRGAPRQESCNKPKLTAPEVWELTKLDIQAAGSR